VPRAALAAVALALLVALLLAGCSGGGSSSNAASSQDAGAAEPASGALADDARLAQGSERGSTGEAARARVRTAAVVRTGRVSLTGTDLAATRAEIGDLLAAVGGTVDDERTTTGKDGRVDRSTLVLRVPVAHFDAAKRALERLGTLTSSTESAEDVTTQVIDIAERVQTLQNSLDRLQRFQRSAGDVDDLVRFEEQITRRQSELQSLSAQQAYLSDRTSLSTITVEMSTPDAAPPAALDDAGFLTGLRNGWQALVDVAVVALTVLGAVLPFLIALPLGGVPLWLGLRALLRRRDRRTPATDSP
jgi:hypothetical protein